MLPFRELIAAFRSFYRLPDEDIDDESPMAAHSTSMPAGVMRLHRGSNAWSTEAATDAVSVFR